MIEAPVPLAVAVPWLAGVRIPQMRVSPFTSVACKVRLNGTGFPFLDITTVTGSDSVIAGGVFTVTLTVMAAIPP